MSPRALSAAKAGVLAMLLSLAVSSGCSVPSSVPAAQRARYAALRDAIEKHRVFLEIHCWCRAYIGGLCGEEARRTLGLSPTDIPLLAEMGKDNDVQVVLGVVDMLRTIGEPAYRALQTLMDRKDEVGAVLRIDDSLTCTPKWMSPGGSSSGAP